MIAYLMRRNLPRASAVVFSLAAAAAFYLIPDFADVANVPFFVIAWAALPQRGSIFDATLPIRGREIVFAQILWALPLLWFPLVAYGLGPDSLGTHRAPLEYLFEAAAAIALGTMLPYAVRPAQVNDLPFWILGVVWAGVAAGSAATAYLLPPAVAVCILFAASLIAARLVWVTVPDAMETAPRRATAVKPLKPTLRSSASGTGATWNAWKPLFWTMFTSGDSARSGQAFRVVFIYVALFMLGTISVGRFHADTIIYVMLPIVVARSGTRWLSAFPLSNRFRLWCVLLPGVVLSLAFLGLGRATSSLFLHSSESMSRNAPYLDGDRDNITRVPLEYWQRAVGGVPPRIESPWGDVAIADTFSVASAMLFNPYTTHEGESARFIEWQLARATTAVYGLPIGVSDYKRREREGTLPARKRDTATMQILNVAGIIAVSLLLVLATEVAIWHRLVGRGAITFVVRAILIVPFFAYFAINLKFGRYPASEVIDPLFEHALWRLTQTLPAKPFAIATIAVIPVIAIYALLEWQFGASENLMPQKSTSRLGRALARPLPHFHTS